MIGNNDGQAPKMEIPKELAEWLVSGPLTELLEQNNGQDHCSAFISSRYLLRESTRRKLSNP